MPDRTEQELLRRARGGDNAAFGHLQAGLERTVRRYVWRLIGQNDDEDEVVQDAFFALYMSLERITPVENLRPFLFRIVRNRCYDELRKQGRFQSVSLDGELVGAPAHASLGRPTRRTGPMSRSCGGSCGPRCRKRLIVSRSFSGRR